MSTDKLKWQQTTNNRELILSNEVHVWHAFLDVTAIEFENLLGFLSTDEHERARRFHFEKDQRRFIVARGILRKILGDYLGVNPIDICFEYNQFGKPILAPVFDNDNVCFNISHSDAYALYAINRGKKIGIDIERVRGEVAFMEIAQKFFSKNEINSLESINKNKRAELFFQYWTRKEAFVKAIGEGVSFPMEKYDVSLINGSVLSPVTLQENNRESPSFYIQDLFPGNDYAAAIAVEGSDWVFLCREYTV